MICVFITTSSDFGEERFAYGPFASREEAEQFLDKCGFWQSFDPMRDPNYWQRMERPDQERGTAYVTTLQPPFVFSE